MNVCHISASARVRYRSKLLPASSHNARQVGQLLESRECSHVTQDPTTNDVSASTILDRQ